MNPSGQNPSFHCVHKAQTLAQRYSKLPAVLIKQMTFYFKSLELMINITLPTEDFSTEIWKTHQTCCLHQWVQTKKKKSVQPANLTLLTKKRSVLFLRMTSSKIMKEFYLACFLTISYWTCGRYNLCFF